MDHLKLDLVSLATYYIKNLDGKNVSISGRLVKCIDLLVRINAKNPKDKKLESDTYAFIDNTAEDLKNSRKETRVLNDDEKFIESIKRQLEPLNISSSEQIKKEYKQIANISLTDQFAVDLLNESIPNYNNNIYIPFINIVEDNEKRKLIFDVLREISDYSKKNKSASSNKTIKDYLQKLYYSLSLPLFNKISFYHKLLDNMNINNQIYSIIQSDINELIQKHEVAIKFIDSIFTYIRDYIGYIDREISNQYDITTKIITPNNELKQNLGITE